MGAKFPFTCSECDYSVEVSGGRDFGFFAITQTITCSACKRLVDIKVGEVDGHREYSDAEVEESRKLRCPVDGAHRVKAWGASQKCPRCRGKMEAGPASVLWD